MKITDFLSVQTVIPTLASREKNAVLQEIAGWLASTHPSLDKKRILEVLLERERISTTAIGEGVAIPHGKLPDVERVLGVFARNPNSSRGTNELLKHRHPLVAHLLVSLGEVNLESL